MASVTVTATAGPAAGAFAVGVARNPATLVAAIDAAQAAIALVVADATVAGNPTALGLAQAASTAIDAVETANNAVTGDVKVTVDVANIPTRSKLRDALNQIGRHFDSGVGGLTP